MDHMKCILTDSDVTVAKILSKEYIKQELLKYFHSDVPIDLVDHDYLLLRTEIGFEFAYPMKPGSEYFYKWITSKEQYYPEDREEWTLVIKEIKKRALEDFKLLDVGCGDGDFLIKIKLLNGCNAIGIDLSNESVDKCIRKGLDVSCKHYDSINDVNIYNYIVLFHVLEHISDPISLILNLKRAIKKDGSIFISTPYSPMSFEYYWFDCLNYPPHHLTRWNKNAFEALAKIIGCNIKFHIPKAKSLISRAKTSIKLSLFGTQRSSKKLLILKTIMNFNMAMKILYKQFTREKINGSTAPDVILVELTNE